MVDQQQTSEGAGELPVTPVAAEATPSPEEARQEPQATVGEEVAKTPKYTEEELKQRIESVRGGHEGTVKKMREDLAAARKALTQAQAAAEEVRQNAWLEHITQEGGDTTAAQTITERARAVRAKEIAIASREAELSEREAIINEAGRNKSAHDLTQRYELDAKDVDVLLKSSDPKDMELLAAKLHIDRLKTKAVAPESPDKGRGTPKGVDISKMSIRERLGAAADGRI